MTKVLVLSLYYPPHGYGGFEMSCRDVMDRLVARGHEVVILTSDLRVPGVDDPPDERASGVRRDLSVYFRDDALYAPSRRERWRMERHNQRVLRTALDDVRPDVVSVWQMSAMSTGMLTTLSERGIPLVYAVCDDWPSYSLVLDAWARMFVGRRRSRLGRLLRPILRVPTVVGDIGRSGAFCFVSRVTHERAERDSAWDFPDAAIVYSGIDSSLFPPRRDEGRSWSDRLLYAGRYDPRKGIETLIRAVPLLDPGTVVELHGTAGPEYRDRLVDLVAELGITDRIAFGGVPRAELAAHYAGADVVVFPSEWEEPFGLVPIEAMSCGVPVVASGVGGSGEFLVDDGNCVMFEAGNPASLAAAVLRLATDPMLRARLVANGFRTAAYFDIEVLADTFEAWHDAAARGFTDGRPPSRRFSLFEQQPADG